MNKIFQVSLALNPLLQEKFRSLQNLFIQACIEVASAATKSHTWNRVALHHLTYKILREKFPLLGAQMACNAIFTVSKISRETCDWKNSQLTDTTNEKSHFQKVIFDEKMPVIFDKHTLSLKGSVLSLFTLEGRAKVKIDVNPELEEYLREKKLLELMLKIDINKFTLLFIFREDLNECIDIKEATFKEYPKIIGK
jgi:hypothetical protein